MEEKKEKLAIHLTFKRSEKQLCDDLKKMQNATKFIKDIISQHLYGSPSNEQINENKMVMGVDDICKIIESATKNFVNTTLAKTEPVSTDTYTANNNDMESKIEKLSDNGFYNNDIDDSILKMFS